MSDWYKFWLWFVPAGNTLLKRFDAKAIELREPIKKGFYEPVKGDVTDLERFDYFMKTGADFKGQVNCAFKVLGWGTTAEAKVDIAQVFLPGSPLTASAGGSISVKGAPYRFIMLEYQGDKNEFHGAEGEDKPLCLCCMTGGWGALKIGLAVEAGVKFSNLAPIAALECVGFNLEAKATAGAKGSYEGTYLHISDTHPRWYKKGERSAIQKDLIPFLKEMKRTDIMQGRESNSDCYLHMWTHTGEFKAGASASVSVSSALDPRDEPAYKPGLELGATLNIAKVKGDLKAVLYSIQTPMATGILETQSTTIYYKQLGINGPSLSLDLKFGIMKLDDDDDDDDDSGDDMQKSLSQEELFNIYEIQGKKTFAEISANLKEDVEKYVKIEPAGTTVKGEFDLIKGKEWEVVNSMSYQTGIAYWSKKDIQLWKGSGYIAGQSVVTPSLIKYYYIKDAIDTLAKRGIRLPDPEKQTADVNIIINKALENLLAAKVGVWTKDTFKEKSSLGWKYPRKAVVKIDDALKAYGDFCGRKIWKNEGALKTEFIRSYPAVSDKITAAGVEIEKRLLLLGNVQIAIAGWVKAHAADPSNGRRPAIKELIRQVNRERKRLDAKENKMVLLLKSECFLNAYKANLANALHVSLNDLKEFLDSAGNVFRDMIHDPGFSPSALLIEAAFEVKDLTMTSARQSQAELGDFRSEFMKRISKNGTDKHFANLQSIRLRYRISDVLNKDNTKFKLGIDVTAVKLGISLDRVNRFGSEGIFDVYTHWFGNDFKSFNNRGTAACPPQSIPPANLLT